jgi:hypothetical protein
MQINGADNSYLARFLESLSAAKPNTHQPGDTSGPDASLQTDYAWLTSPEQGDTDAVSRARQLIASGGLDESAAALIAAENILKLGI